MTVEAGARAYHHGNVRVAAIAAAVEEIEDIGVSAASMRGIARRAGVSHAALAHHFTDKAGIFTAVATDGFRRASEAIGPAASDTATGFLAGGLAYVNFALTHRGYFEVMFRPNLYRVDDADLIIARDAAFAILYGSAREMLRCNNFANSDEEVTGLVMAGWSMSHGLAVLALTGSLSDHLAGNLAVQTAAVLSGISTLGKLVDNNRPDR